MSKDKEEGTIFPVILNQTNLLTNNSANNIYSYKFPGSASFKGAKVAISSIQMYYSWQNINSTYGNNTLSIIFPTAATTATVSITIPNGSYSVTDLNAYLQSVMITNGYYLVDGSGNYIYYIELVENATAYSIQLNCYPVPTTLPTGYTNPGGWVLPTTAYTPQLVVPNTAITSILGFATGTFPPAHQTTTYSKLSTTVPQLSPVSSVIVGCNLVNNKLANPRNVIYSFSPNGTTYGSQIVSNAYQYSWVDVQDGTFGSIDITFYDQNFGALQILDTNIVIFLLIKM